MDQNYYGRSDETYADDPDPADELIDLEFVSPEEQQRMVHTFSQIKALAAQIAPGPYELHTWDGSVDELASVIADVVRASGGTRIWWVGRGEGSEAERSTAIVITGNGQRSEVHAKMMILLLEAMPLLLEITEAMLSQVQEV
jgi:hypothetical protein